MSLGAHPVPSRQSVFWTAHDECVLESGEDDLLQIQIHAAKVKIERGEQAIAKLEELERAAAIQVAITK